MKKPAKDDELWHQSGVNLQKEPFVQLLRGDKLICQMTPEQARDHAQAMIQAAEAAETDAFLFHWMTKVLEMPAQAGAKLLAEFRKYREAMTGKSEGPTKPEDWVMPPPDNKN